MVFGRLGLVYMFICVSINDALISTNHNEAYELKHGLLVSVFAAIIVSI